MRDRVVDLLILQDQTRLLCVAIAEQRHTFLFRTEWLKEEAVEFFSDHVQPEIENLPPEPLLTEIIALAEHEIRRLEESPEPEQLRIGLLREYLQAINRQTASIPNLVLIRFPESGIRLHAAAASGRNQLGLLAMLNNLPSPESASWRQIVMQLSATPQHELIRTLPHSPHTDADPLMQQVLAAIDIRAGNTAEFINSGARLIPKNSDIPLPMLAAQMLGDQLQGQLQELLQFEPGISFRNAAEANRGRQMELPPSAAAAATTQGLSTVCVSGFEMNPDRQAATVWQAVYRKSRQGHWTRILHASSSATAKDVSAERMKLIASDPRVQQISTLVGSTGVTELPFNQALLLGAVVQLAHERSAEQFHQHIADILNGNLQVTIGTSRIPMIEITEAAAPSLLDPSNPPTAP